MAAGLIDSSSADVDLLTNVRRLLEQVKADAI